MIQGVGHVGIAVKNIEESVEFPEKKMKCAVVDVRGIGLEFIEDYSEEGAFATFVKERGNAIHHVCLLTDDIEADIKVLEKRGVEMADQEPRIGLRGKKIAFTRPSALKGIPMELSEP
jgi:methylmalonyl-CoA epimerase